MSGDAVGPTRRALLAALGEAMATVDIATAVEEYVRSARIIPTAILAAGKAAPGMLAGARRALDGRPTVPALVVVPDGVHVDAPNSDVVRAGHPTPDRRSLAAGRRVMDLAGGREPLLVLVSGGASALVSLPSSSLGEKRAVTAALLASGADIHEINIVRRHLSRVKGGRLAAAAHPAPVVTAILSDVLGGAAHEIGSGLTVGDPSSVRDARRVLSRHAPQWRDVALVESIKPRDRRLARARARIVGAPRDLARLVAAALAARGFAVTLARAAAADVDHLAAKCVQNARELAPGQALVRMSEPTVRVRVGRPGAGGRSTHLATLVGPALPPGVVFLAAASDGVDGASKTGGAVVSARAFAGVSRARVAEALASFASGDLIRDIGAALPEGPTGLNYADVHVIARARG